MMSVASSGVMRPCLTASLTSAINAGSSLQGQLGSPQKGCSVVGMMASCIRTRRGWRCWQFAIVVTVLSVLLEHMFGLTAGSVTHTICGESRAGASTVTTVLNGWHSVARRYASKHYKTTDGQNGVLDEQRHGIWL